MLATLGDAIAKIRRLLGDNDGPEFQYSDELITDGILEALKAILPWCAKEATFTHSGDGATFEVSLPDQVYEVEGVYSSLLNTFIPRAGLYPGAAWYQGQGSALDQNYYLEYPHGKISLSTPPGSNENLTVYYTQYWQEPTDQEEPLEPPDWTYSGICLYACSYVLSPKATSAANIRQFNTKVDSGTPIHNPMVDMAKFFLQRFEMEMARHPTTQRGQKTR